MDLSQFSQTKPDYPPLTLECLMPFGKYKGEQIEDIIDDDPDYMQWLYTETNTPFDDEVSEILSRL